MELGLKGKRAIVMAASRGLGYASALGLAREGCRLVICSRDQARVEAAAEAIRKATGTDVQALVADVSSAAEAKRLVDAAVSAYGGLEIVVHNAGGPPAGETLSMTDEQWQKAFEQNLLSFTRIVAAAAPEMKKAGYGRILTIASSSIKQQDVVARARTAGNSRQCDRPGAHRHRAHRRAGRSNGAESRQVGG
jgi:3-oxoacyl-[acyl-carrier protein] reductase